MLSKIKYAGLCVLAMEVFYVLCIAYGSLLSGKARELHQSLFELIPGFAWGSPPRIVWGALYLGALALVGGWYIAWMHNVSLVTSKK